MGSGRHRRRRTAVASALACIVVAAGCSSAEPQAEPVDLDRSAARSVIEASTSSTAPEAPSVLDDPSLNPEGVINAAVLLHSGEDPSAALAAGAFTRAELDAARSGLADGSLDYLFD